MNNIKNKLKRGYAFLLAALFICSAAACSHKSEEASNVSDGAFYEGISIGGVDVSGLSFDEASEKISELKDENTEIILKNDDTEWTVSFEEIGIKADYEKAFADAYKIMDDVQEEEKDALIAELKENPVNIDIPYVCDETLLKGKLGKIEEDISAVKNGANVDIDKTTEKIVKCLAVRNLEPITLIMENDGTEEVEKTLIGSFSTSFSSGDKNRNENLRVACEKINGTVLQSGDIFDMNELLGPQTTANGYKAAGVIENGKIVSDIGGGVCQVTTTVYNAAIFAELKIVERHNHSLMVGYVPLGRDAAVAGTYKNLRFQNDTDYPVEVEAYIEDNKVVCNIYGHEIHDANHKVDFERVWIATIPKPAEKITEDSSMYEGEREVTYTGKTGAKIDTYKLVYEGDKLISREWFSSSTYVATSDEVRVGTKPKETEDVPVIGAPDTQTEPSTSTEPTAPVTPTTPTTPETPETPATSTAPETTVAPDTSTTPDSSADLSAIGETTGNGEENSSTLPAQN